MNIDDARQWRVDNSWKSFVVWILYCSSPFQQFHESSRLIQNFYWGTSSEFTSLPSTLQPYNKITKNSIESHFHNLRRIFEKRKIHKHISWKKEREIAEGGLCSENTTLSPAGNNISPGEGVTSASLRGEAKTRSMFSSPVMRFYGGCAHYKIFARCEGRAKT